MAERAESVLVVGTGIAGASAALELDRAGYHVDVVSAGPDISINAEVELGGASGNGRPARLVTTFEGTSHLPNPADTQSVTELFSRYSKGGCLPTPFYNLPGGHKEWLYDRLRFARNIEGVAELNRKYVQDCMAGIVLWQELQGQMRELFDGVRVTDAKRGVLVLCNSPQLLEETVLKHEYYGAPNRQVSKAEIIETHPAFEKACAQEKVIAGGIYVNGFGYDVKGLIKSMINYLQHERGVTFSWNTTIDRTVISSEGRVIGLRTTDGDLLTADHYALFPGAYGNNMLRGTPAEDQVRGVAGRWLDMHRPEGLGVDDRGVGLPIKYLSDAREGGSAMGDNNLSSYTSETGEARLAISGGSVLFDDLLTPEINTLMDAENRRIARLLFGLAFKALEANGKVETGKYPCIRSFTRNGAPAEVQMETERGGKLFIATGHNTGTATVALPIARRAAQALRTA